MFLRNCLVFAIALSFPAVRLAAEALPEPKGDVILTITGSIENTNAVGTADFDLEMLADLTNRDTSTETPWHEGTPTFSGPLGAALLDLIGATGGTLRITALNDYMVEVPVSDLHDYPVIFATHIDGMPMSVRDKGPIFLIYPFSEYPELLNEVHFGRSAWQIRSIEVID
jgi:hypothetical protein